MSYRNEQITKYIEIIKEKGHANMKWLGGVRKNLWDSLDLEILV